MNGTASFRGGLLFAATRLRVCSRTKWPPGRRDRLPPALLRDCPSGAQKEEGSSMLTVEFLASPEDAKDSPKWGFDDGETPPDGVFTGGWADTDPPLMSKRR